MTGLPKVLTSTEEPTPGDFHARVDGEGVHLPGALTGPLRGQGVHTLPDILSYAQSFPSAVAGALRWPVEDVVTATRKLEQQLAGVLTGDHLRAQPRPEPSYGAMDVDLLP